MSRGIYKRGDTWWIRYAGPDGQTVCTSSKSKRKADAESLYIRMRAAVLEDKHPDVVKKKNLTTLKEFTEEVYLKLPEVLEQKGILQKTYILRKVCRSIGHNPIQSITPAIISAYLDKLGSADATKNRHLSFLKRVLRVAADKGVVREEVSVKTRQVKAKRESAGRIKFLSVTEVVALLAKLTPYPDIHDNVKLALNTGLRRGSIDKLTWDNVDLSAGTLYLPDTKSGSSYSAPLNSTAVKLLSQRWTANQKGGDLIFTKWRREEKRIWTTALQDAGITGFRYHDLRHTFISHLVMSGVNIVTVQRLAGHKTMAMTLKYVHLTKEYTEQAIEQVSF